jgi:hypothetical protein
VDYFAGIATLNRQRNAAVRAEAIQVARSLAEIDVTPVFLKGGGHLLSGLHADPADRFMLDLDILIPHSRLTDCVVSLQSQGFEPLGEGETASHHHYLPIARPDSLIPIELHVDPLDKRYDRFLRSSNVFETAVDMELDGVRLAVPSPTCRIVQSIVHAELSDHGLVYGKIALRELLDVALISRKFHNTIRWPEIARKFKRRGALACQFQLLAACDLLGARPNTGIAISATTRLLYRRALWQLGHPRLANTTEAFLRPGLLLARSLSQSQLRGRLARSLRNPAWYRRQWKMLYRRRS